jgi:multicomponent Na+:H+ antiporter subunit B
VSSEFKTDILDTVGRKLGPYVLLFGCYMISYGHVSPGGGFQGGVVLASGGMLILLGCREDRIEGVFPFPVLGLAEAFGFLIFLGIGISGILFAGFFLASPFDSAAESKSVIPWFIYMLNMVIGMKVGAGVGLICIALLQKS